MKLKGFWKRFHSDITSLFFIWNNKKRRLPVCNEVLAGSQQCGGGGGGEGRGGGEERRGREAEWGRCHPEDKDDRDILLKLLPSNEHDCKLKYLKIAIKVSMGMPMQCNGNANDLTALEMLGRAIIAAATTRLLESRESAAKLLLKFRSDCSSDKRHPQSCWAGRRANFS